MTTCVRGVIDLEADLQQKHQCYDGISLMYRTLNNNTPWDRAWVFLK